MARKCRHRLDSASTTLEIKCVPGENPLWFAVCKVCGAHTVPCLTVTETRKRADSGYLSKSEWLD